MTINEYQKTVARTYTDKIDGITRIDESLHIADNTEDICEELYDMLVNNVEPVPNPNGDESYLIYNLINYQMVTDCFIKNVTIRVIAGKKGKDYRGSYFSAEYNKTNITKDGKINNAIFTIAITDNDITSERSKEEFFSDMTHELNHAYRYSKIMLGSSVEKEIGVKGNVAKAVAANRNEEYSLNTLFRHAFYLSDKDEVNARLGEVYEYVRHTKGINNITYKNYIHQIRLLKDADIIKTVLNIIESNINSERMVDIIGSIYKGMIANTKISNRRGFMDFRRRLISMVDYITRNVYSIIYKVISDEGRYFKPDEEKMERITKAYNEKMLEHADFNTYLKNTRFHMGQDIIEALDEKECNKLSEILRKNGINI